MLRIFLIVLIVLGVVLFILGPKIIPKIESLCFSNQQQGQNKISSPIFSPDGSSIAFIGYENVYRPAVGICTFPDGGAALDEKNEVQIYTRSIKDKSPHILTSIPINGPSLQSGSYAILGEDGESLYLWIISNDEKTFLQRIYFQVNLKDGSYKQLSSDQGKQLEQTYWGQSQFNPNNEKQWLDFDTNSKSIGIYTGGMKQMDKTKKVLFMSGDPSTALIETVVDSAEIAKLQPQLKNRF